MTTTVRSEQAAVLAASEPSGGPASRGRLRARRVFAGVDTHQRTHVVAVIDDQGVVVGEASFTVDAGGYQALTAWLGGFGRVVRVGVEGTGGYGAGLTRHLLAAGIGVVEVDRPDRAVRARQGKSDPLDALAAARAVASGRAAGLPKLTTGAVEALRMVVVPRDSAVKDRTRAYNQLRDLITTAPAPLHDELIGLTGKARVALATRFRPPTTAQALSEPVHAAKHALRTLARRIQALDAEITEADTLIDQMTIRLVPTLRAMHQIGPHIAAQLVITAGENLERMTSEARFAKLTGTAPLPATSGKRQHRHRLNRGGDRQANRALHLLAVGRLQTHQPTRDYQTRRRTEGLTNPEIIRCLKRTLARHTYQALKHDLLTP